MQREGWKKIDMTKISNKSSEENWNCRASRGKIPRGSII